MTRAECPDEDAQIVARPGNEGDAADAFANALPEGITSRLVREYLVGSYRYTDLALAIAERDRQRAIGKQQGK